MRIKTQARSIKPIQFNLKCCNRRVNPNRGWACTQGKPSPNTKHYHTIVVIKDMIKCDEIINKISHTNLWIVRKYPERIVQECNQGVAGKAWQRPNSLMNQSLNQWVPAITALPQTFRDPKESCSSVSLGKRGGTFPVGIVSWRRPVLAVWGSRELG